MPELPEIEAYLDGLDRLLGGRVLEVVRLRSPSLLKTWEPPLRAVHGRTVTGFHRIGKRVVWEMEGGVGGDTDGEAGTDDLFLVFHLMITGRFHWKKRGAKLARKTGHAAFDFEHGTMLLTEQSVKKRASLHLVRGRGSLAEHDPGGLEPLEVDRTTFGDALRARSHTLKRALTDPRILAGIGNAHSDEILLRAGLSPLQRTVNLSAEEIDRLWREMRRSMSEWTERLREENAGAFPERITAFHPAMAAHGRHGEPCPACGTPIQRIAYADRETNYCPTCQTGGKLLADRGMSRLLGDDWPRTLEELEELKADHTRRRPDDP